MKEAEINIVALMIPKSNKQSDLVTKLNEVVSQTRHENGNIEYTILQESSGHVILIEQWQSQSALNMHLNTSYIKKLVNQLDEILEYPIDTHFAKIISE